MGYYYTLVITPFITVQLLYLQLLSMILPMFAIGAQLYAAFMVKTIFLAIF